MEQQIKDAATAAATAAVTAALAGVQAQQPQVIVQKQLNIQPFVKTGDILTQGLDFLDYVKTFEYACASAHITDKNDMKNNLLTYGGKTIRIASESIKDDEVDGDNAYEKLINKCKKHFISTEQSQIARAKFFNPSRGSDNEIEFFLRLRELQEHCMFTNLNQDQKDELLRDILIANLNNPKIQNYCMTNKTNLKDTIKYISTTLNIQAQTKSINKSEISVNQINSSSNNGKKCPNCLLDARHRECFAKFKDCKKCGRIGHFARACRQGQQPSRPLPNNSGGSGSNNFYGNTRSSTGNRSYRPQQFQRGRGGSRPFTRNFARQVTSDETEQNQPNQDNATVNPNAALTQPDQFKDTLAHSDEFIDDISASFSRHISLDDRL